MLDRGLVLWNVPLFQVLGLSTPLAPEQRADGQVRTAFSRSMFMYYPEPNRAGSHGTSGVGVVIVLGGRYVLLIICCSAEEDAVGVWVFVRGPRGVSRITRCRVREKAGG